jgi:hypothetical protein
MDFNSGITSEEFYAIAKQNSSLSANKVVKSDFDYTLFLKSSKVNVTFRPYFNEANKLYRIYVHGETKNRTEIIELEKMLKEKYKIPTITIENTNMKMEQSSCLNWVEGSKEVRFCCDSFPNYSNQIALELLTKKKVDINTMPLIYCFEIQYVNKEIENEDLSKKTRQEL